MDGYFGELGLFSIFSKIETCARYVKSKGISPVICLRKSGSSFYSDEKMEDIWSKFYNQPDNYTLEEVMQSKNVFISPGFYNGSVQSYIMNQESGTTKLVWTNGTFNQCVEQYIREKEKLFLPFPEKTLGVHVRGTDFVHTHLHNHPIHASLKEMFDKIDEVYMTWENIEYIYVATEDAQYMEAFREKYGSKVYFTDQQRYITSEDQLLSDLHRKNNNCSGFQMGVEYILAINLLAKCNSRIVSGGCSGLTEALKENDGNYKNVYIFEKGKNS